MKRISDKTKIRKRCVDLAKKIAKHQAGYKCEYDGCTHSMENGQIMHGSHIYGENTYVSMSADPDNILCLCSQHHLGFWKNTRTPSWHNNPMEMTEWFRNKYPERAEELKKRAQKIQHINWEMKLGELKSIYGELIN